MNMLNKPLLNGYSSREGIMFTWFIEKKLDVQTQQRYRTKNGKDPPSCSSICQWHKNFLETGSVLDAVRSG